MVDNFSDAAQPVAQQAPSHTFAAAKAALYRRYRPETFADVIGQEHVTAPLMRALDNNRIGHAYLFSGPRGCGKTTSARILARCLNCAVGPTSTPCGTCPSCVELSRDGSGSLDVVEIDAASHGGVDDARELRERATFAPARDRFKIFILDEAHMVTAHGFNALLKLVEEPPAHVKFIFATTEPEKVIGTIRSRTHHYPFRLIPGTVLTRYLEQLCEAEGVPVEKGVLPMVVRAGTGSARDTLSVLDQLMAGSTAAGIDYRTAVNLLGFTDGELLNSMIDAISAGDAASVFQAVDRVVTTGHDPRRFVEDLLDRFRDLILAAAVPETLESLLPGVPEAHLDTLRRQASVFGSAALSRAADVTSEGLNGMHGPTAPRIQLELLCARLLLPGVDNIGSGGSSASTGGLAARVERMERRLGAAADSMPAVPGPNAGGYAAPASQHVVEPDIEVPAGMSARDMARQAARRKPSADAAPVSGAIPVQPRVTVAPVAVPAVHAVPAVAEVVAPVQPGVGAQPVNVLQPEVSAAATGGVPGGQPPAEPAHMPQPAEPGALDTEAVRTAWPNILERLKGMRRVAWMTLNGYGQVLNLGNGVLNISFSDLGAFKSFSNSHSEPLLAQAVFEELGLRVTIDAHQGQHVVVQPVQPLASTNGQRPAPNSAPNSAPNPAPAPVPRSVPEAAIGQAENAAPLQPQAVQQPQQAQQTQSSQQPQQAQQPASMRAPQYPHSPDTRELRSSNPGPATGHLNSAGAQTSAQAAPRTTPHTSPNAAPQSVQQSVQQPVQQSARPPAQPAAQSLGYDEWPEVAQPPNIDPGAIPQTGPIRVLNPDLTPASAHEAPPQQVAAIAPEEEPEFVRNLDYEPLEVYVDEPEMPAQHVSSIQHATPAQHVLSAQHATSAQPVTPAQPETRLEALTRAAQEAEARELAAHNASSATVDTSATTSDIWAARNPEHRPTAAPVPKSGTFVTQQPAQTPPAPVRATPSIATPAAPETATSGGGASSAAQARAALAAANSTRKTSNPGQGGAASAIDDYYDADPDDPSVESLGQAGPEVVMRLMGGEVIEEIDNF